MAFASDDYSHDVFVSYSRASEAQLGQSYLAGWSRDLVEALETVLLDLVPDLGSDLDIFIDQKRDPTLYLSEDLEQHVQKAALLLIIMSPHFLRSRWCRDEIDWFRKEIARRGPINGKFFVVRAVPTREENWPDCLKDKRSVPLDGFWFHPQSAQPTSNVDNQLVYPFGYPKIRLDNEEFFDVLKGLASILTVRLRQLKKDDDLRKKMEKPPAPIHAEDPQVLYLDAKPQDQSTWKRVRDRLSDAGYKVIPENPPEPLPNKNLRALMNNAGDRASDLVDANALLIVGSESDEPSLRRLTAITVERRSVDETRRELGKPLLPCILFGEGEGNPQWMTKFNVESINVLDADWRDQLDRLLGRVHRPS